MAEQAPRPETKLLSDSHEHETLITAPVEHERHHETQTAEQIAEHIRSAKEQAAHEAEPTTENPFLQHNEATPDDSSFPVSNDLKDLTFQRSLRRIQKQLPLPQKVLSKAIHQPVVRILSEGTSKTISRPSGLLGGGLMAFIGTSAYVYFTHYIGIPYNYLWFLVFFVGGFFVGLGFELLLWLVRQKRVI